MTVGDRVAVGDFVAARRDWVALGDRATTAELIFMVGVSLIIVWCDGRGCGGGGGSSSGYGYAIGVGACGGRLVLMVMVHL
jgi:hypothetical protein